ncbi:MAG: NosD domain-containing protein [Thermoplasmata archaeon]
MANCLIKKITSDGFGIILNNVKNATLLGITFINCRGIRVSNTVNLTILKCIDCENSDIISCWISESQNITISNSSFLKRVLLIECKGGKVVNNVCGYGLTLSRSEMCVVLNNTIEEVVEGGLFAGCVFTSYNKDVAIVGNIIRSSIVGICVFNDYSLNIFNNTIYANQWCIDVFSQGNITLRGNRLYNASIGLTLTIYSPPFVCGIDIDETNYVNDLPVIFIKDRAREKISFRHEIGEVIFLNCTNLTLSETTIKYGGINVRFCRDLHIINNKISDSYAGIFVYTEVASEGTYVTIIENNTIFHNTYGILFDATTAYDTPTVVIKGNIFYENYIGCEILNCLLFENNYFFRNEIAIDTWASVRTRFENNTLIKNREGLYLDGGVSTRIVNNSFIENEELAITLGFNCGFTQTYENAFINNNNNTTQVWEGHLIGHENGNCWNSSSAGNFWSNWLSPDNNSDGFVDKPYPVPLAGHNDFLPLTRPSRIIIVHEFCPAASCWKVPIEAEVWGSKLPITSVKLHYKYQNEEFLTRDLELQGGDGRHGKYLCTLDFSYNPKICEVEYYITAEDESGNLESTNMFWFAFEKSVPQRPTNLQVEVSPTSSSLFWLPPLHNGSSSLLFYNIYRGISPENKSLLASVDANTTSFVDTNVTPGITYYYHVTAVNAIGESEPSNTVCVTVPLAKLTAKILVAKSTLRSDEENEFRVIVADAETGEPVKNATVSLSTQLPGKFESLAGQTDANGTFTTKFVAGNVNASIFGKLVANISAEHYENATTSILLGILPGEMKISVEIDKTAVKVGENFTVVVSVKDENGRGVENATVEIFVGQNGVVAGEYQKVTNAEGGAVFTFSALKEGNLVFQVIAKKEGFAEAKSGAGVWIKSVPEQGIDFGIPLALLLIVLLIVGIWEGMKGRQKISS